MKNKVPLAAIHMLGDTELLEWSQMENAFEIALPAQKLWNYALTLKINLKKSYKGVV